MRAIQQLAGVLYLAAAVAMGLACDSRPTASTATNPPAGCPKCECKCSCPDDPAAIVGPSSATPTPAPTSAQDEIEDLSYGLSRKVAKRDATCLADLDRLKQLSPKTEARMQFARGQCLMLAGRCEAGAAVVRKEMAATTELMDEQLDRTIETYSSMYCQGPMDERGELLRALAELQKGAYQGNIGIRACTNAAKTIVRLRGRVRPKNEEDSQIVSLENSFAYSAAACLARAGDCAGAWKVFNDESTALRAIADPAIRAEAMRSTFDSVVPKCKGKP